MKIMLKILVSMRTIWIEIIKGEGLHQNQVNFNLICIRNCKMAGRLLNTGSGFEGNLIHEGGNGYFRDS